jgi:polar amino acid transport system substrate-binding protein
MRNSWILILATLIVPPLLAADLAPTGTLRAAFLGSNPVQGRADPATGVVTGPAADLVRELAGRLKVPYVMIPAANAREVIDRVNDHSADIGFLARDDRRAAQVSFSVPYLLMANAYIVRADSPIRQTADADRAGLQVGAVRGQSQETFLSGALKNARVKVFDVMPVQAELERLLVSGEIDAFGGNRQRAEEAAASSPGLRVLPDNFLIVEQAIVIEKSDDGRMEEVNRFLADILASGVVEASIGRAKLAGVEAAAPPSRKAAGDRQPQRSACRGLGVDRATSPP